MLNITSDQLDKIDAILEQLDCALANSDSDNRRRFKRVRVRVPLNVILMTVTNSAPIKIHTRNLSVSGMGFVSRRPFKSGERVAVQLSIKGIPPKLVLAKITFGRYISGGMYEMGAEFFECIKDTAKTRIPAHWLHGVSPNESKKKKESETPDPKSAAKAPPKPSAANPGAAASN